MQEENYKKMLYAIDGCFEGEQLIIQWEKWHGNAV